MGAGECRHPCGALVPLFSLFAGLLPRLLPLLRVFLLVAFLIFLRGHLHYLHFWWKVMKASMEASMAWKRGSFLEITSTEFCRGSFHGSYFHGGFRESFHGSYFHGSYFHGSFRKNLHES